MKIGQKNLKGVNMELPLSRHKTESSSKQASENVENGTCNINMKLLIVIKLKKNQNIDK